jgi:hypothetical protein
VVGQAKSLKGIITTDEAVGDFESRLSASIAGTAPADADGFRPGVGRITGAALKAVWDANAKSGGIPSGNDFRVPGVGVKDVDASGNLVAPVRDAEEYALPMKPVFLTALVPAKAIESNDFTYIVQKTRDNRAAVVADGGTKPTSIYDFDEKTGTLDVIAHMSEAIKNRLLQDRASLQSWIYGETALGLELAAESELVDTILSDMAVQSQSFSTDILTSIRKGVTKLQTKYVRPDFLAISIEDAEVMDLERYTFDGHFIFDGPRSAGPNGPVWSVPLVINDAVPQGSAIMGSAQVGLRRYVNGQAMWALDTLTGFEVNTTRSRLEQRSKSVVTRPFAVVVVDLGTGS